MLDNLPAISLFQDLAPAQIDLLKPIFEQYGCPPQTKIFEHGDPAIFLYLLIKGEVAIQYKPYDGPAIILTHLHAGDAFGWSAVVGSSRYTSSIVSESDVETVRIKGTDFLNLVKQHPETGEIIMDRLASVVSPRWKNAHEQVQSLLNSHKTN